MKFDSDDVIRDGEDLLRAACPDVAGYPMYVLRSSEAPDCVLRTGSGCAGFTFKSFDLTMRDQLEREGRWQGRGCAMFIDEVSMDEQCHMDGHFMRAVWGVMTHELAHWLCFSIDFAPNADIEQRDCQPTRDSLEVFCSIFRHVPSPKDLPVPWHTHQSDFIRAALHLAHRINEAECGRLLFEWDVLEPEFYGLSGGYSLALGDEPSGRVNWQIRAILASDPPAAFTELWESDTALWNAENGSDVKRLVKDGRKA